MRHVSDAPSSPSRYGSCPASVFTLCAQDVTEQRAALLHDLQQTRDQIAALSEKQAEATAECTVAVPAPRISFPSALLHTGEGEVATTRHSFALACMSVHAFAYVPWGERRRSRRTWACSRRRSPSCGGKATGRFFALPPSSPLRLLPGVSARMYRTEPGCTASDRR